MFEDLTDLIKGCEPEEEVGDGEDDQEDGVKRIKVDDRTDEVDKRVGQVIFESLLRK